MVLAAVNEYGGALYYLNKKVLLLEQCMKIRGILTEKNLMQ